MKARFEQLITIVGVSFATFTTVRDSRGLLLISGLAFIHMCVSKLLNMYPQFLKSWQYHC